MAITHTYPLDLAKALWFLGYWGVDPGVAFNFTGDTSANNQTAFNNLTWLDARTKPTWQDILDINDGAIDQWRQESFYDNFLDDRDILAGAISNIATLTSAVSSLTSAVSSLQSAPPAHNHAANDITSGTKTAAFISDFTEASQDAVGGSLSADFVYSDGANTISKRAPAFTNNASRSFVTTAAAANGFQISSDRDAAVAYDVTVSSAVQIGVGTNVAGYVALEVAATNSATAGDWQEVARAGTGQNIGLALALSSTQTVTATLAARVPAGYYARLRTVNTNGTPTYTYLNGQEVLL